ncbi:Cytochrome P450 [Glarea lozoyensis ATCC 20868]|uniref:Cytochrome P450 n=1 Tax=Glarea lozoyensis (strain ATCC 20868 / MF5171) TaxID=1116229 RepID=S3EG66_GLAL2|nr:Cytochrome P450 [Glarea lozoyensis ATCC 20868]EPE37168.1 Cytochrome P450 [Glarea lozoyensis ATCC 20868]
MSANSHARLSAQAVFFVVGLLCILVFHKWLSQRGKIVALGGFAPGMKTKLPFGLRWIIDEIHCAVNYDHFDIWQKRMRQVGTECRTLETRFPGPFGLRIIWTDDPENIKAILVTDFEDWGKGERVHHEWMPLLGNSIFMTDGALWHASRQLIRPHFTKKRVSDLNTFETHVQILIKAIKSKGNTQRIDMQEMFKHYALDIATEFILGKSAHNMLGLNLEFAHAFGEAQRQCVWFTKLGPAKGLFSRKKYLSNLRKINNFIEPFVDEVLSFTPEELQLKSKREKNFLHSLATFSRDRKMLRDQIIGVLLGGRDTVASGLSWALYELARHPEIVTKLRHEISAIVGLNNAPSFSKMREMKYLQYIINETLRLYPSVAVNCRFSTKNTSLPRGGTSGGRVGILNDTLVVFSPIACQRHRIAYPLDSKIEEFDPERWVHLEFKQGNYFPFSGGPRICVGQQFALAEMGYTLVRLFQTFSQIHSFMDYERLDRNGGNMQTDIVLELREGVEVGFMYE